MPTNKKRTKSKTDGSNGSMLEQMANDPSAITVRRLSRALPGGLLDGLREGPSGQAAKHAIGLLYNARSKDADLGWNEFYMNMVNLAVPGEDLFSTVLKQQVLWQLFTLTTRTQNGYKAAYGEEWMELVNRFKCDLNIVIQNNRKAITMACFANSEAKFLEHCEHINAMPPSDFRAVLGEKFVTDKASLIQIARQVQTASIRMTFGLDQESPNICWECNARKSRFTCSICCMAAYCSDCCQHRHWDVHRSLCKRVRSTYKAMKKAEAVICKAMSNVDDHSVRYGAKPSLVDFDIALKALVDRFVVDLCHKQRAVLSGSPDIPQELDGPSMANFYKNVNHVALGDFGINSGGKTPISERVFGIISQAMMYNYENDGGAVRVDWLRAELTKRSDDGESAKFVLNDWLETYKCFAIARSCEDEVLGCFREMMLIKLTKWFREEDRLKHLAVGVQIIKKMASLWDTDEMG